jgi:two-component system response regulator PilR (NtrC family)
VSGGRVPAPLPQVVVVDDQFGRCQLGDAFRRAVGEDVFALFEADRANLCRNFGLLRAGSQAAHDDAVARAVFCPAQKWNDETREIENVPEQAVGAIRQGWPAADGSRWALVLLDLRFTEGKLDNYGDPERGSLFGAEVLLPLLRREFGDDLPIVVLSSTSRDELNATVRELGALDFIQRVPGAGAPPEESRRALREVLFLHGLVPDDTGMVAGTSLDVLKMLRQARRGARSARTILLEGETGTGKGLLARYIHAASDRARGPFETFNAAQRTAELQADELFGHWQGAFTDARTDIPGIWERAQGGTLFIDEVADLDESVQLRLMQPIEERRVRRLGHPPRGAAAEIEVDVRVLLATNRSLAGAATLKKDFLNRINAFVVHVPPLRDRREDIPLLAARLVFSLAPAWSGRILPAAMKALQAHEWRTGNVRELRNVLERALANNPQQDLTERDLQLPSRARPAAELSAEDAPRTAAEREQGHLLSALTADLESLSAADLRRMRGELSGSLPPVLAALLIWAMRLTATDGKLNHTAAVRFLLGRNEVTTLEAKQFLRKYLSLDTRGGSVWRAFEDTRGGLNSELLDQLMSSLRRRSRQPDSEP